MLLRIDEDVAVEVEPSELAAVDFEASGLHRTSYPTEAGWCGLDLEPRSYFIRPADDWGFEDWSPEAQAVHGVSRSDLMRTGLPVEEATRRFEEGTRGKVLVSDNPSYEGLWGARLFVAAGRTHVPAFVAVEAVMAWAVDNDPELRADPALVFAYSRAVRDRYPHVHRADLDALSLAAYLRVLTDADFRDAFREGARLHLAEERAAALERLGRLP